MSELPTLTSLPVGTVLNERFHLQEAFAAGGFSLVYRAIDLTTAAVVIVKECAPSDLLYRDAALNLQLFDAEKANLYQYIINNTVEEANLLHTLTQQGVSGITSYVDSFYTHNSFYIVMGEAVGHDLHAWMQTFKAKGVPFPAEFLQKTLTSVLDILSQIHAAGYFHCDIKPANILINEEGKVTIIDFGAARSLQKQHDDTVAISPGFSPPEFYPGNRSKIGPWTDIYMLAAMVYSIITGKVPQPADERIVRDLHQKLVNMTELQGRYPDTLLASVSIALVVDAKERFQTADAWRDFYSRHGAKPKIKRANRLSNREKNQLMRETAQRVANCEKKTSPVFIAVCCVIIAVLIYFIIQ